MRKDKLIKNCLRILDSGIVEDIFIDGKKVKKIRRKKRGGKL